MGCDIHFVVEVRRKQANARWMGVLSTDRTPMLVTKGEVAAGGGIKRNDFARESAFRERYYEFFAALAGVRGGGPDPKGLPDDVSDLAKDCVDSWSVDGHSHSWDMLDDFVLKWLKVLRPELFAEHVAFELSKQQPSLTSPQLAALRGTYFDSDEFDARVVYWFDN